MNMNNHWRQRKAPRRDLRIARAISVGLITVGLASYFVADFVMGHNWKAFGVLVLIIIGTLLQLVGWAEARQIDAAKKPGDPLN